MQEAARQLRGSRVEGVGQARPPHARGSVAAEGLMEPSPAALMGHAPAHLGLGPASQAESRPGR